MAEARPDERLSFYLTQRLNSRDRPSGKGFDALFECHYMGASEFEWGAIPESLARMRAARKVGLHIGRVTRKDITIPVFVVGDVKRIESVPDALTAWIADDYPRGKEMTYFPERVEGAAKEWHARTDAWWSLTDDVMWALDADTADRLLRGVRR